MDKVPTYTNLIEAEFVFIFKNFKSHK